MTPQRMPDQPYEEVSPARQLHRDANAAAMAMWEGLAGLVSPEEAYDRAVMEQRRVLHEASPGRRVIPVRSDTAHTQTGPGEQYLRSKRDTKETTK